MKDLYFDLSPWLKMYKLRPLNTTVYQHETFYVGYMSCFVAAAPQKAASFWSVFGKHEGSLLHRKEADLI